MGAAVAEVLTMQAPTGEHTLPRCHANEAQAQWATVPLRQRLKIVRRARHLMATRTDELCAAVTPTLARNSADTLIAELLPLLDACRFLERRAVAILKPRRLGRTGLPWWLGSLSSRVERVPLGQILVIAPANYPLFLPGVQTLQALAAGNAVVWKPGAGGRPAAELFAAMLHEAGLPPGLLTITEESIASGRDAVAGRITGALPDKVVFTGSFDTGREILRALANSAIPCVAELSGCDSVVALPSADFARLAEALAFGMRLNGSATCMAPRRLFLVGFDQGKRERLLSLVREAFARIAPTPVPHTTSVLLEQLLLDARSSGAEVVGGPILDVCERDLFGRVFVHPWLILHAEPAMEIARTDIFAPVLSVIDVPDAQALAEAESACPYALTISLFGNERDAAAVAGWLTAGTLLINDIIVPTADPRIPFGGRRRSGFGATRGAEGLLEMTAPRATVIRRGNTERQYQATGPDHVPFFEGMIRLTHAASWPERLVGIRQFISAARRLR
jgi:acyl-CoA reductase-like NAD-dependent aldehyde dehydrogenase